MRRPQFTLRALLATMLVVAAFFGGIHVERERRRREDEKAAIAAKNAQRLRDAELTALMRSWTADVTQIRDMRDNGFVDPVLELTPLIDGSNEPK